MRVTHDDDDLAGAHSTVVVNHNGWIALQSGRSRYGLSAVRELQVLLLYVAESRSDQILGWPDRTAARRKRRLQHLVLADLTSGEY